MKILRQIFKSKSNWPSLIGFIILVAAYVIGFFSERFSYITIGGMFIFITIELFIRQVMLIENIKEKIENMDSVGILNSIQNRLNIIKSDSSTNHIELKKRDEIKSIGENIRGTKHEFFTSGINMHHWSGHINTLKQRTDLKIRILVLDTNDSKLCDAYADMRGRPMVSKSSPILSRLAACPHIEIREINAITPAMFTAYDMDKSYGYIRVEYLSNDSNSDDLLNIELTPGNQEWYEIYQKQIEAIWNRGKPWNFRK